MFFHHLGQLVSESKIVRSWSWQWWLVVKTKKVGKNSRWRGTRPLKLTAISHLKMDGWKTIVSFWEGLFLGAMLVLPKIGIPQNGWFIMENPINMDNLGVQLFLETPMLVLGRVRDLFSIIFQVIAFTSAISACSSASASASSS